jgi:hypothetical protein
VHYNTCEAWKEVLAPSPKVPVGRHGS